MRRGSLASKTNSDMMSKRFDRERYYRERRPKNIALLMVLVGLVVLFFSITLVKMRAVEERRHERSRSEEHTSELQSLMRISYAVFCLKKTKQNKIKDKNNNLNSKIHTTK